MWNESSQGKDQVKNQLFIGKEMKFLDQCKFVFVSVFNVFSWLINNDNNLKETCHYGLLPLTYLEWCQSRGMGDRNEFIQVLSKQ